MTALNGKLSVKTIWGKVVLQLKERKQIALHVACGDITDVELSGNSLIINVTESVLAGMLEDGRKEIERAISWQGLDLKVVINLKEKASSAGEQDIEKLNQIFDDVKVIEKKIKLVWR